MKPKAVTRYRLAFGTQVREEDFGLLFYTMAGPRLYFLSSGNALESNFFEGRLTLDQWLESRSRQGPVSVARKSEIAKSLRQLKEKGVILEC